MHVKFLLDLINLILRQGLSCLTSQIIFKYDDTLLTSIETINFRRMSVVKLVIIFLLMQLWFTNLYYNSVQQPPMMNICCL